MTQALTHGSRLSHLALAIAAFTAMLPAGRVEAQAKRQAAKAQCNIIYTSNSGLTEALRGVGLNFVGYDGLCHRLREADMAVDFTSSSGVLRGRSYGWVTVRLYRRSNGVLSVDARSTTTMSDAADTPGAKLALLDATNNVLEAIASDPEPYFSSVAAEESRLRVALAASVKAGSAK